MKLKRWLDHRVEIERSTILGHLLLLLSIFTDGMLSTALLMAAAALLVWTVAGIIVGDTRNEHAARNLEAERQERRGEEDGQ